VVQQGVRLQLGRRSVVLGALGLALLGAARAPAGDFDPAPDPGFDRWLTGFAHRATASGLSPSVVARALQGAQFLPGVIAKDRNQFEFSLAFQDYLAITLSDARIAAGRQALAARAGLLAQIEQVYAVEPRVLTALWGIESFYGQKRGTVPVISALASLAYSGRRAGFFEGQLKAAIRIVGLEGVAPAQMTGGWAGAMGHTQVIPTTYLAYARDFRGDGVADIWGDDPTDALATAAHYLSRAGWHHGTPVLQEVLIPAALTHGSPRRLKARAVKDWATAGVRPARGNFTAGGSAGILMPAGASGPAFLTWANFAALKHYNASDSYALALGLLADRIAGGQGLVGRFPPDRNGLTQGDRIAVQTRLTAQGYDTGSQDGVFGPKTTAAVKAWQTAHGLPATGLADKALLAALH
jgi:lytic murein transglycosylase